MGGLAGKLTYANVVSTLALFVALTGATAFAAGKVGTKEIRVGAVKSKNIARKAIKPQKIAPNAVRKRHIKPNAVGYRQIAPDSIDGTKVINGSLTAADVAGGISVVTTAFGGPVAVTSRDQEGPDPVPLTGAGWVQAAAENNLFLARAILTVQSEGTPGSICDFSVSIKADGQVIGAVFARSTEGAPVTQTREVMLEGARLAAGVPRPSQLSAEAYGFEVTPGSCATTRVESLQVSVIGIG